MKRIDFAGEDPRVAFKKEKISHEN